MKLKKIAILFLFIILSFIFIITPTTSASATGSWSFSSFIEGTESGDTVYHAQGNANEVKNINYSEKINDFNNISFKYRPNASWNNQVEAHITVYLTTPTGYVGFKFMHYWKAIRISRFDASYNEVSFVHDAVNYENNLGGSWTNRQNEWFDINITFTKDIYTVTVNDTVVLEVKNIDVYDFSNSNISIGVWGNNPSVKDILLSKVAIEGESEWLSEDYVESIEGESKVYTAQGDLNSRAKNIYYRENTKDYNVFTFKYRPNAEFGGLDTSHITLYFTIGEDKYLGFRLMNYWKASRIVLLEGDSLGVLAEDRFVEEYEFEKGWNGYDKWYDVRIYTSPHYLIMTVDGSITSCLHYDHGYDLSNRTIGFGSWGMNPSIKEIQFYKNNIDTYNLKYLDLEFRNDECLTALDSSNGSIAYKDGTVEFSITGSDSKFIINDSQRGFGSYSAKVDVRNAVMFRLKNESEATKIKLLFNTTTSTTTFEKEFDVEPNSSYKTYLVNYSDLNMTGYLSKLTVIPLNVSSGKIVFDSISFEREDQIYDYAAEYISATASKENSTITISGKVKDEYASKDIHLVISPVTNYTEAQYGVGTNDLTVFTSNADGTFDVTIPLFDKDNHSLLSQLFIASVKNDSNNYIKLSKPFAVENYYDFIENPYAFTLPELSVRVTDAPYNAVGDAFTDDTDAIQSAIDYVALNGGGVVIIPGDTSTREGRRYIITHIELKDNIELRIEKGATLWQSPRVEDYKYNVLFGHDYISTSMWPHCCNVNEPLILIRNVHNVRVTGGGTIRMMDAGDENTDPRSIIDPNHGANCANIIHIAPMFIVNSHDLEVSDITIIHTNNWHLTTVYSSRMYFANNYFKDPSCKNSDGFGLACARDALLVRNFMYSNDDSYTINSCPTDPRRDVWWAQVDEKETQVVENIEMAYNNLYGGLGLCFITWGQHTDNLEKTVIRNIVGHDNYYSGEQDMGCWPDDPFYGESQSYTYTFREKDYSAIQDVYLYNNVYVHNKIALNCIGLAEENEAVSTNFIMESYYECSSEFLNNSFERDFFYDTETEYLSGLVYWSSITNGGSTGIVSRGTKTKVAKVTQNSHTVTDYAAKIDGDAMLYQGLYLKKGVYVFKGYLKTNGGTSKIFAGKSLLKQHVYEPNSVEITNSVIKECNDYSLVSITFEVKENSVYALGFIHTGEGSLSFDDVTIESYNELYLVLDEIRQDLEYANNVDLSVFTNESQIVFLNAVSGLESVLNAQDLNKSDCDNAVHKYDLALDQLELKPVDPVTTTEEEPPVIITTTEEEPIPVTTTEEPPVVITTTEEPIPVTTTEEPPITTTEKPVEITTTTSQSKPNKKGCKSSLSIITLTPIFIGLMVVVVHKKKKS